MKLYIWFQWTTFDCAYFSITLSSTYLSIYHWKIRSLSWLWEFHPYIFSTNPHKQIQKNHKNTWKNSWIWIIYSDFIKNIFHSHRWKRPIKAGRVKSAFESEIKHFEEIKCKVTSCWWCIMRNYSRIQALNFILGLTRNFNAIVDTRISKYHWHVVLKCFREYFRLPTIFSCFFLRVIKFEHSETSECFKINV